jgi:hypothetical protein
MVTFILNKQREHMTCAYVLGLSSESDVVFFFFFFFGGGGRYGKVAERDSVQKSLYPPKGEHYENALLSYYRPYAEGRANGTNARRYL